jgi:hypothetical protein
MSPVRLALTCAVSAAATLLAVAFVAPLALGSPASTATAYTATKLKVTANPPTVTKGSQAVTFSGKVTGTTSSGKQVAIASVPIRLSVSGGKSSKIATTASNGTFSYKLTGIKQTASYDFTVAATSTYPAASKDVTVDAVQAATAVTATASATSVTEGSQQVTFTGAVTVTAAGATSAAGIGAGVPVDLSVDGGPASRVATTDNAKGDFSYTRHGISHAHAYTFSVGATPLYTAASAPAITVTTVQAPAVMTLKASPPRVTFGSQRVTFTGTVTANPAGAKPVGIGSGTPVYLSISGGPVTEVTATDDAKGDFTYTIFNISKTATYAFSVNPTAVHTGASDAIDVHLYKGKAAMTVTASPPDINLGSHTVTFSGTVTVTPFGSTKAIGVGSGVPVYLAVGSGTAAVVAATSDSQGDFSYTATGISKANDYNFSVDATRFYSTASAVVPIGLDQVMASITVTPSPASITEGSQSVTFSGTLTGVAPGSTKQVNIKNAAVDLSVNGGSVSKVATTDSKGNFSYTASNIPQAAAYAFSVAATKTYTSATDDVQIGTVQAVTRVTGIRVSPRHLRYGRKARLRGKVQYLRGSTWTALSGVTVHLEVGGRSLGSVTTAKRGRFTASLPTTHGSAWQATISAGTLTQQTSAIGNLIIAVPLRVRSFTASLQADGDVRASGCLQVTVPVHYGPQTSVDIQYSARSRGPWKTLGRLQLQNRARKQRSCHGANESYFSGNVRHRLANAYYRADFPASDSFLSAVSRVVHAWRYETRVTSYRVSPHVVVSGNTVTISGRLWQRGKSWKPYGHQLVEYIYHVKDTSFWGKLGSSRTSAGGYFRLTAVAGTGSFVAVTYVEYRGNRDHLAVRSAGVAVSIREGS